MTDVWTNEDLINIFKFILDFIIHHSIAILIILVFLIIIHFNLVKLNRKVAKLECRCDYCRLLAEKIIKIVNELVSSEKYGLTLFIFSFIIGLIFYLLSKELPIETNTKFIFTTSSFGMYCIALIANVSKMNLIKKFNDTF